MCDPWKVRWVTTRAGFQRYEVFTAPDGREWLRARNPAVALVYILSTMRGLAHVPLRPRLRQEVVHAF